MPPQTSNLADVVAQFLSTVIGRGCYLLLQVFLARNLGPRGFGLYAIGWTVTGLVGTLAPLGMPQVVVRYGLAGRHALHAAPLIIASLAGLASFVLLLIIASPVASGIFSDADAASAIVALAPSVPLLGIFGVWTSALRTSHRNIASAAVGALLFLLYLGTTVLTFATGVGRTPAAAGHAYTIAILLTMLPTAWLLYRLPAGRAMPAMPRLIQFGFVTMLIHSANLLNLWADRLVIGVMADARAVGIYQVASQLAVVAIVFRSAVTTVFEARVPKFTHNGATPPDITREFLAASRVLLHISGPGLICLAVTARFWLIALFGPNYSSAAAPLAVLVIGQLALTFTGPSVTALQMTGGERMAMLLTTATCVLNILGNVAFIPILGLVGSALASSIANVLVGGLCVWRLRQSGRLRLYFSKIRDIMLATAACIGALMVAADFANGHSFIVMSSLLLGAYIVYGSVVMLTCRVEDEAFDLVRAALRKMCRLQPRIRLPAP